MQIFLFSKLEDETGGSVKWPTFASVAAFKEDIQSVDTAGRNQASPACLVNQLVERAI
jgi:hypothetical protein